MESKKTGRTLPNADNRTRPRWSSVLRSGHGILEERKRFYLYAVSTIYESLDISFAFSNSPILSDCL